jgi:hypothetical protein
VEFGPIVQVNGNLKLIMKENNNGTTLLARTLLIFLNLISTFGITAGVRHFRFNVSYQYGINNMLDNLIQKQLGVNRNPGILNGNIILYL